MIRRPPRSPLFPSPTLFRSDVLYESELRGLDPVAVLAERLAQADPPIPEYAVTLVEGVVEHRSEEHTSELQSRQYLVCRLLLEKKKQKHIQGTELAISFNSL